MSGLGNAMERRATAIFATAMLLAGHALSPCFASDTATAITWAGGWRANVSDSVARATQAENFGQAYSTPLSGRFYVEVSLLLDDANGHPIGSIGIWNLSGATSDPGEWTNIGQVYGGESCGVINDGAETLIALTNGRTLKEATQVHVDAWPLVRYGIAGDAATGHVWIRQVWSGGTAPWIGGGDPAAGTGPTSEPALRGGVPRIAAGLPVGSTATIHSPSTHHGTPPAGFTAK